MSKAKSPAEEQDQPTVANSGRPPRAAGERSYGPIDTPPQAPTEQPETE